MDKLLDLEQRIERLEKLFIKLRELNIISLGAIEDAFGIPRTKKRGNNGEGSKLIRLDNSQDSPGSD